MKVDFRKNYSGFYQRSSHIGILLSKTRNKGHKEYNPKYICNYCGQKARRLDERIDSYNRYECREEECRTVASMTSLDVWLPVAYFNYRPSAVDIVYSQRVN